MGRRRIGQEQLAVGGLERRRDTSLDEGAGLVNWAELDRLLAGLSASTKGELRAELVGRGLDRALFEAVTRQLDQRGVVVRTGTLVDATLIPSASIRHDGEAAGRVIVVVSRCTATRPMSQPTRMPG